MTSRHDRYAFPRFMMILDRLNTDLKVAMREKDAVRRSTIRSLIAAIKQKEIDNRVGGKVLTEDDYLSILQKQAKQRRESAEQYVAAERDDLASIERAELAVIENYLPAQLGEQELEQVLREIIDAADAKSMADIGKVMGPAMAAVKGMADGKRVQAAVRSLLS